MPFTIGSNSHGGVDDVVVLSPKEPASQVEEPEEGEEKDKVSPAQRKGRNKTSAQAVLEGMQRVAETTNLTYVPNDTMSSVDVMVSEVESKTGKLKSIK